MSQGVGGSKRKRSASEYRSSQLPSDSINPLSHPPETLKQFLIAGLSDREQVPSEVIPGFPHRRLPRSFARPDELPQPADSSAGDYPTISGVDTDASVDTDSGLPPRNSKAATDRGAEREHRAYERRLGVLTAIIRRGLADGDIARAKAAFGALLRAEFHGLPVDLRRNGYWTLGAEILIREGEVASNDGKARRWGSGVVGTRVRAYFMALIQQHPYIRSHAGSLCALQFWPAMVGVEVYSVYTEYRIAVEDLESAARDEVDNSMDIDGEEDHDLGGAGRARRLRADKDGPRRLALEQMREIASRMDERMQDLPYKTDFEMVRLRGMVSLYISDLAVPLESRSAEEESNGRKRRQDERRRAASMFRQLLEQGNELERWIRELVLADDNLDSIGQDVA